MKKVFLIIFFFLFSLYTPAELTRYIIAYKNFYGYAPGQRFEIWWIWIGYTAMMVFFNLILWTKWEDKP